MSKTKQKPKAKKQERVTPDGMQEAIHTYQERAVEHATAAQEWKDGRDALDVRLQDLVRAHQNQPFDEETVVRVSKAVFQAVVDEKALLAAKQEAKKALDEAWVTYQSYIERDPARPMLPDPEPEASNEDGEDHQ